MRERTNIACAIEKTDGKSKYDMQVKEVLADKNILARILKGTMAECANISIDEIKAGIKGEVSISSERLAQEGKDSKNELVGMLNVLLSCEIKALEKLETLESDYGIPMTTEVKGKVIEMCNLSSYVEEKGIKKGEFNTIVSLVKKGLLTLKDAAEELQITAEELVKQMEDAGY